MPSILDELIDISLNFNKNNPRDFDTSYRCIAYAFDGSRLISVGYNTKKTPGAKYKIYADDAKLSTHAEIMMLKDILKKNKENYITDIVVVRGTERLLDSKPCKFCLGFINKIFTNIRLWYFKDNIWNCLNIK